MARLKVRINEKLMAEVTVCVEDLWPGQGMRGFPA